MGRRLTRKILILTERDGERLAQSVSFLASWIMFFRVNVRLHILKAVFRDRLLLLLIPIRL